MYKTLLLSFLVILSVSCRPENNEQSKEDGSVGSEAADRVTIQQNFSKQIILTCRQSDLTEIDSLVNWIVDFKPGGLKFEGWPIESIQELGNRLDSVLISKPLFFSDYFDLIDLNPYPLWGANKDFQASIYWQAFKSAGIISPIIPENVFNDYRSMSYLNKLPDNENLIPGFKVSLRNKTIEDFKPIVGSLQKNNGCLWFENVVVDSLPYQKIRTGLNFEGLIVVNSQKDPIGHLNAGADMVVIPNRLALKIKGYRQTEATKKTYQKVMALCSEFSNLHDDQSAKALLRGTKLHFIAKSTVIFNRTRKILPIKHYRLVSLASFLKQKKSKRKQLVQVPFMCHDSLLQKIVDHQEVRNAIIAFSNPIHYKYLRSMPNLLFNAGGFQEKNEVIRSQLKGELKINGNLISDLQYIKGKKRSGGGIIQLPPEFAFLNSTIIRQVSSFVNMAIDGKAFPGCQVLVIKNNVLVYNKSFGYTNYQREAAVDQNHIFDLASLTKVLATSLVAMKLWEDGYFKLSDSIGSYLPDTLSNYLPNGSTIKYVTFQELLTHHSGLPAGFPVIKYMRKATDPDTRFQNGFCDYPYEMYTTEVAENLYMNETFQDSMWLTLNALRLNPEKDYKYSDVNMNVLYFLLKNIIVKQKLVSNNGKSNNAFESYLYQVFYKPLGMKSTCYQPLKRFAKNKIVPTENDRFWRKQLLQGYVHDPNAALYGGIAGNAGLFSNALDLGPLLTMWQSGGIYKGKRYLKQETIQKFSEKQPNTHRGLGFNKRTITNSAYAMADSADVSTYGHTGFTGTCFWIDPVNELTYVFLSNRVHPKVTKKIYEFNIRKRVHQVFYDAMLK